jgi:hypothetical protein
MRKKMPSAGPAEISGNGLILDVAENGDGWKVSFACEPRTSPQPLWFNVVATDLQGAPVTFIWENPDITLGSSASIGVLRPVMKADDGPWQRCAAVHVEEHPDGRRSLRFDHAGGADRVAAAFCFPYATDELNATLDELGDAWQRSTIGVSGEGRRLERLRLNGADGGRMGLYLMARQHSGETPGSWVLDGILRFLASDDPEAVEVRKAVDVWACPFVDLDGAINGDYGKDALPWDFNRAWETMPMRPEVQAIQRDLQRWMDRTGPRLVIDLHGPGHSTPGIYLQLPREQRPVPQREGAVEFARLLAPRFPELDPDRVMAETRYASRWNMLSTAGAWVWDYLQQTQCVSVETSYQRLTAEPLYPDDYRDIGRRVALTAFEWLSGRSSGPQ